MYTHPPGVHFCWFEHSGCLSVMGFMTSVWLWVRYVDNKPISNNFLACCQGSKPILRSFSDTVCIFSCSSSLWRFYREGLFDYWYKHHAIIKYHTRSFRTLLDKVLLYPTIQGRFVPDPTGSFHTLPNKVVSYPTLQGCKFIPYHTRSFVHFPTNSFLPFPTNTSPYPTVSFCTLPYKIVLHPTLQGCTQS